MPPEHDGPVSGQRERLRALAALLADVPWPEDTGQRQTPAQVQALYGVLREAAREVDFGLPLAERAVLAPASGRVARALWALSEDDPHAWFQVERAAPVTTWLVAFPYAVVAFAVHDEPGGEPTLRDGAYRLRRRDLQAHLQGSRRDWPHPSDQIPLFPCADGHDTEADPRMRLEWPGHVADPVPSQHASVHLSSLVLALPVHVSQALGERAARWEVVIQAPGAPTHFRCQARDGLNVQIWGMPMGEARAPVG